MGRPDFLYTLRRFRKRQPTSSNPTETAHLTRRDIYHIIRGAYRNNNNNNNNKGVLRSAGFRKPRDKSQRTVNNAQDLRGGSDNPCWFIFQIPYAGVYFLFVFFPPFKLSRARSKPSNRCPRSRRT